MDFLIKMRIKKMIIIAHIALNLFIATISILFFAFEKMKFRIIRVSVPSLQPTI